MKARARLLLAFPDGSTAAAVAAAVSPDDDGFIRTRRSGKTLHAEASADSPMSLLHTLDDYLACISVAERTALEARPPGRTRRRRA
jgi:hypothetical protein